MYIADTLNGGSLAQFAASTHNLRQAALDGSFAVTEDAGQQMIKAIDKCVDGLNSSREALQLIHRGTPLGTSPAGLTMAKFNQQVAIGDNQSAIHALERFREVLAEARAAIEQAMRNYREADSGNAGIIRHTGV